MCGEICYADEETGICDACVAGGEKDEEENEDDDEENEEDL